MDGGGGDPDLLELAGEAVGAVLGAAEHHGRPLDLDDAGGHLYPLRALGPPEDVATARGVVVVDQVVPGG